MGQTLQFLLLEIIALQVVANKKVKADKYMIVRFIYLSVFGRSGTAVKCVWGTVAVRGGARSRVVGRVPAGWRPRTSR